VHGAQGGEERDGTDVEEELGVECDGGCVAGRVEGGGNGGCLESLRAS